MVKTVLGVSHQGLRDWSIQRLSAIFLALYVVGLAGFFLDNTHLEYNAWHHLFTHSWMKVATFLFFLSLITHAWVGMWTVFTDYIKPYVLCVTLNAIVLISLLACLIWALQILWGV